ncbi:MULTISPECIES: DUF6387 family protein [Proteus]|uniref:DUF6387 family protein n=1 Tax=Proteus TaxID=583 RepID=UPI00137865C7|nr:MULTISPECIES: DUF6387 family protein [Proteus]EKX9133119.1 hypothetical protein [Proteus mirabilis]MCL8554926.1 DUF6387 family protein [Proteus mirabilis]MCL8598048.1 DUF6387 family protein [Proteus mirabilis]MCT0124709.1 hypothetical protein [Proteus mirabilis]MDF7337602.1 DUF6387 family protein [Proteus mirabilis]
MKISNKKDLPKWFNLSDYDCYNIMPDDEIIYQLSCRYNALITEEYKENDVFFAKKINKGVYIYNDNVTPLWKKNDFDRKLYLSKGKSISPMTIRDAKFMFGDIKEKIGISISDKVDEDFNDMYISISAINKLSVIFDGVFCKIDLMKSDEVILYEMSHLLKTWRNELDIPDDDDTIKNGWYVVKDKILSYRMFPLIDLILWEKAMSNKITNGVLAVSLFPNGEYDSINIAQTIRPFAMSLLNYKTLEKFEHEISNK